MSNIVHKENGQRASVLQHVSLNVRRLRHAAGLSQGALAEISGVSRRMLVAIEAGEKKDECQHQNDGGDVEAGLEREPVGEGHCVTAF